MLTGLRSPQTREGGLFDEADLQALQEGDCLLLESQRLFSCLRKAEGGEAGEEAFEDLREFLAERNAAAALAMSDRKEEILVVHRLNVPATLNVTLLSTNAIENVIRNWREQTGNVKRW
ncbi:MAG: hypothetical protein JNJ70_00505, partial [Verrucomicrobiales bacterium]|nr:hypothetical protein [Verrucomicrobiales bacterium]